MGARVSDISDINSSAWAGKKPKCYKGNDLDKALSAWEKLKPVKFPEGMLPEAPAFKLGEIEGCEAMVKGAIKDIEKLKKEVEEQVKALNAVTSASEKASSDLKKMYKDKKLKEEEQNECFSAANEADSLGRTAEYFVQRNFQ